MEAGLAPGPIDTKRFDKASIDLGDEHGPAVGAAEGEIARLLSSQPDFTHQVAVRGDNRYRAVTWPRHIDLPIDVDAQSVELRPGRLIELLDRACGGQAQAIEPVRPNLTRVGLTDD